MDILTLYQRCCKHVDISQFIKSLHRCGGFFYVQKELFMPSYTDNAILAITATQCLINAIRGGRILDALHLKALGKVFGEEIPDVDGYLPPTGFQAEVAVINLEGLLSTLQLEV